MTNVLVPRMIRILEKVELNLITNESTYGMLEITLAAEVEVILCNCCFVFFLITTVSKTHQSVAA